MNLARHNEWVWTSRWTNWWSKVVGPVTEVAECMDPFFQKPLDTAAIARGVKTLQQARINTVLTEGLRRVILFEQEGKTDAVIDAIRRVTTACHRADIRVVHHTTTVFAGHRLSEIPKARRSWLNIDARTGSPAYIDWVGGWYLWCINNPDFRAEYFRLCQKILRETGVDGFMVDEVYFRTGWHNCACPHCRKKYRATTGFSLPRGAARSFWGRFENPAFRAWIRFRTASVGDFYADLQVALRKVHPHPVLLGCKNHEPSPSNTQELGDSNEERMRGVNLLFTEAGSVGFAPSWRRYAFELSSYGGLSSFYGTPALGISYSTSAADTFWWWALRMAHGLRVWATASGGGLSPEHQLLNFPKDIAVYAKLFRWEESHEPELAGAVRPLAEIGVLLSAATRDLVDHARSWDCYVRELVGWCEALTEEHLQYAVIVEQELTLARLRQFALVILPNAICLSDAACEALTQYVAGGGHVIVTHETGMRDETGSRRSAAHRLRSLGATEHDAPKKVSRRTPQQGGGVRFGRHGQGRWAYFTHKPGLAVYATAEGIGDLDRPLLFTAAEQSLQRSLMIQAVRWATGDRWSMTVPQAPRGLLIKAFSRKNNGPVVHLLQCGESVTPGKVIPASSPVADQDLRLAFRLDSIKQAYLISPDWRGKKPAKLDRVGGECRVVIPWRLLRRYAALCLSRT